MDKHPVQLLEEKRVPLPAVPGYSDRLDYEYDRKGSVSTCMFTEPRQDWCRVLARVHRTAID